MSIGRIPKDAEFGAGALPGGKVGVKTAKKRLDVPVEKSGGMAAMLLHAAHHATRQMPPSTGPQFGSHGLPPIPVWATALVDAGSGAVDLRIAIGRTDIGFLLTSDQAETLGQALIAASVPKTRPQ